MPRSTRRSTGDPSRSRPQRQSDASLAKGLDQDGGLKGRNTEADGKPRNAHRQEDELHDGLDGDGRATLKRPSKASSGSSGLSLKGDGPSLAGGSQDKQRMPVSKDRALDRDSGLADSPHGDLKASSVSASTSYSRSRTPMDETQDNDGLTGEPGRPPRGSSSFSRADPRSASSSRSAAPPGSTHVAPPPMLQGLPLSAPSAGAKRYVLNIRQHPKQGRQCGFGVKDKRPLDPLPIIQLRIFSDKDVLDEEATNSPNLLMQASLIRLDAKGSPQEATLVAQPSDTDFPWTRMLEGRLAASAHVVRDLDGSKACFFVFTDLSVRLEGRFRLHFQLILLGPPSPLDGTGSNVVSKIESDVFTIYSPRRFPGMTESTELAKSLARQGVQIPIRNDVRRKQE